MLIAGSRTFFALPTKIKKIIWKLSRSGSIIIKGRNSGGLFHATALRILNNGCTRRQRIKVPVNSQVLRRIRYDTSFKGKSS